MYVYCISPAYLQHVSRAGKPARAMEVTAGIFAPAADQSIEYEHRLRFEYEHACCIYLLV